MTLEELSKLYLNQRVSMTHLNRDFKPQTIFGYVTKIYNGNYQVQVLFDGYKKPVVVGYSSLSLI